MSDAWYYAIVIPTFMAMGWFAQGFFDAWREKRRARLD